jgi:hypothetical protein
MKDRTEYFRKYQKRYKKTAKGKLARRRAQAKYRKTVLGRATTKRYEVGLWRTTRKALDKRYARTAKGRASSKRKRIRYNLRHPLRRVWNNMLARCFNPTYIGWKNYGGATPPVRVCKRWLKFENFSADMGTRPKGTSLSRFGDIGNYSPSNCAWHTKAQQLAEAAKKRERNNEFTNTNPFTGRDVLRLYS